jgi:hypothetical protein
VDAHLIITYWSTNNNGSDTNDLMCVSELPGSFKAVLTIIANLDFFLRFFSLFLTLLGLCCCTSFFFY